MENDNLLFGLKLFKTQLQDALTMIGKAILKNVDEKFETMTDQEKLDNLKVIMANPFEEIASMCEYLNKEYKEYRDSPELTEHVKTLLNAVADNPDILDEFIDGSAEDATQKLLDTVKNKKENDGNLQ